MNIQDVSIADIIIGERRRSDYGDIQQLADSITARQLLHPITVVREGNKFRLAAGERRIRAFQLLGLTEIPAKVYSELSEEELRAIEWEENRQRKDLTIEESRKLVQIAQDAEKAITSEFPSTMDEKSKATRTEDSRTPKGRPETADKLRVSLREIEEKNPSLLKLAQQRAWERGLLFDKP